MTAKVGRVEAVRGFVALYVFGVHLLLGNMVDRGHVFAYLLRFGQEAVIVFFLISGFVMEFNFQRRPPPSFSHYFRRRFTRIYPILLLALLLGWLMGGGDPAARSTPVLLGNLIMQQDLHWVKPGVAVPVFANNLPLWSLSYEWWFYMVFYPLRRFLSPGVRWKVVVMVGLIGLLILLLSPMQWGYFAIYLPVWWLGCEICRVRQAAGESFLAVYWLSAWVLLMAGILAIAATSIRGGVHLDAGYFPGLVIRHLVAAVVLCWLTFVWQRAGWAGFDMIVQRFAVVAPFSFGLYALHFPIIMQGRGMVSAFCPSWAATLICGAAAVVLAVLAEGLFQKMARTVRHAQLRIRDQ